MCQVSLFALPFYILIESISTVNFAGTPYFMQGCTLSPSSLPSSAHAASLGFPSGRGQNILRQRLDQSC